MSDALEERLRQRVGTVVKGKWTVDQLLGYGGMAAVYAATHRNKRRGALKVLHRELSLDKKVRDRFLREGYVANSVGHDGAVEVFDDDVAEDGAAFIVMELLEGETLATRANHGGGTMGAARVLGYADQLLETLAQAHDNGIVHRDIKPDNLFLTRDGKVKVLDFGIARLRDMAGAKTKTQTGDLLGTPAFMAPEQAAGRTEQIDKRSDIFAVGATMYTLLTGDFVHTGETVQEMIAMAVTKPCQTLEEVAPKIHPEVRKVVDKALAFDKEDRYADARAMRTAVRNALVRVGGEAGARTISGAPAPAPTRLDGTREPLTSVEDESTTDTVVAPADLVAELSGETRSSTPGDEAPERAGAETVSGVITHSGPSDARRGGLLLLGVLAVGGVAFWLSSGSPETEAPTPAAPPTAEETGTEEAAPAASETASVEPTAEATAEPTASASASEEEPPTKAESTAARPPSPVPVKAPPGPVPPRPVPADKPPPSGDLPDHLLDKRR